MAFIWSKNVAKTTWQPGYAWKHWAAYSNSPEPLVAFDGAALWQGRGGESKKEREWEGRRGKIGGRKGRGREGREEDDPPIFHPSCDPDICLFILHRRATWKHLWHQKPTERQKSSFYTPIYMKSYAIKQLLSSGPAKPMSNYMYFC